MANPLIAFSVTTADAILAIFCGTAPTTYASIYWQLHVGDPGVNGTANLSAGSTTREISTIATPSGGASALGTIPGWTNTGDVTETLTYVTAWSASSSGTFLFSLQLIQPVAWVAAQVVDLSLILSLPIAS